MLNSPKSSHNNNHNFIQTQAQFSSPRQQTSNKNAVKINFCRKTRIFDNNDNHQKQKYIPDIAPWNSNSHNNNDGHLDTFTKTFNYTYTYTDDDDIKGITRIKNKNQNNKNRRNNKSWDIANRAAITARSWNAQRERLVHLRKELKMNTPVFPTCQNQGVEGVEEGQGSTFLGYLRRKNQDNNSENKNGHSSDIFHKHRKLLSRIYSHSCEPKIIIRGLSHELQNTQTPSNNIQLTSSQKLKKIIEFAARKKQYKILYNFENFGIQHKKQPLQLQIRQTRYLKSQQKMSNKTSFKTTIKSAPFNAARKQFLRIN